MYSPTSGMTGALARWNRAVAANSVTDAAVAEQAGDGGPDAAVAGRRRGLRVQLALPHEEHGPGGHDGHDRHRIKD